jgi:hypothetical protein
MAKLKSFEQFLSEMDRAEEVQQDVVATAEPVEHSEEEAEEVQGNGDAVEESTEEVNEGVHPKLKKAQKAIKNGETVYGENVRFPGRFKIIELGDMFATVDYEDGTKPMEMASMNIRIDSLQFESVETEEVNEGIHAKIKKAIKAVEKGETVYGENIRFPGRFKILSFNKSGSMATVDYQDGTKPMEMVSMNIAIDSLSFESVETETVEESCGACNEEPCVCESEKVAEGKKIAKADIEEVADFRDGEGYSSNQYYILADFAQEKLGDGPYDIKEIEKLLKSKEVQKALKGEGEIDMEHLEEFSESVKTITESGEEAGLPAEDLKDETKEVDNDVEAPEDKSKELETELEDTVDGAGNEEISESEESEESEEVAEEEAEETKAVSDMLSEVYEACKNEAKAWESDAHDEHTVETYMKENAALVGGLAAKCLKEMKEDYSVEAYEAACNEMIEAYSKKVNEMKESDSAVGEETPEA